MNSRPLVQAYRDTSDEIADRCSSVNVTSMDDTYERSLAFLWKRCASSCISGFGWESQPESHDFWKDSTEPSPMVLDT